MVRSDHINRSVLLNLKLEQQLKPQAGLLKTTQSSGCLDWRDTKSGLDYEWDSDQYSLQIQTKSTTNDELLRVYLMGEGESFKEDTNPDDHNRIALRFIDIKFSEPMKYLVGQCFVDLVTMKLFDKLPPPETEKIWTIAKSDTQLSIQCSGIQVLKMNFNGSQNFDCERKWSPNIRKIRFSDRDTVSRCFRTVNTCSFESNDLDKSMPAPKLKPDTLLPILPGDVVTLYCDHDWFKLNGDKELTCTESGSFEDFPPTTCSRGD